MKFTVLFALVVLLLGAACGQRSDPAGNVSRMKGATMVAGPSEKSFSAKYDPSIHLPMPEKDFLSLLISMKLEFEVYFDSTKSRHVPEPRWSKNIDVDKTIRIYQIYGDFDENRRVRELYWAYVDDKSEIVYIENRFSYTGP